MFKISSKFPERFKQDESGQWWHLQNVAAGYWCRIASRVCPVCHEEYLAPYRAKSQETGCCSKSCGIRWSHSQNPGRLAGEKSGRWLGGRREDHNGYVLITDRAAYLRHGGKSPTKATVMEHRLVMEAMIGRPLTKNEQVHHKNGIRNDNRPDNLELWVVQQPVGARVMEQQHCPSCTCFLHKKE